MQIVIIVVGTIISIHALLAESDELVLSLLEQLRHFYPRSPCGERPWHLHCVFIFAGISIHALLAESDGILFGLTLHKGDFYPRSPCGERHDLEPSMTRRLTFLSTLSLRRATASQEP